MEHYSVLGIQVRRKLRHNCAAVQFPIGLESDLRGLVDLVQNQAFFFHGVHGCVLEIYCVAPSYCL